MVGTGIFPIPPDTGGGVETHLYHLSKKLVEFGVEVHCISDVSDYEKVKDIKIYEIKSKLKDSSRFIYWIFHNIKSSIKIYFILKKVLKKEKFDIIHVQDVRGNLPLKFAQKLKGDTPIVFTVHGLSPWLCKYPSIIEHNFRKFVYKFFDIKHIKNADFIISVDKSMIEHLSSFWKISKNKMIYIPNGIDTKKFKKNNENINFIKNYCLFVGHLIPRKGVEYLVKAMKDLNYKCLIVGNGPELKKLKKLVINLKLNNVIFFGSVKYESDELINLYSNASFFVLPSLSEAFPFAVLEAMSCELPVISTKVGELPEIVKDNYNGFLVEPANVKRLREKIQFLADNPELCKEMGKNARKTVEEKYSWEVIAKRTIEVYKKVLSGSIKRRF